MKIINIFSGLMFFADISVRRLAKALKSVALLARRATAQKKGIIQYKCILNFFILTFKFATMHITVLMHDKTSMAIASCFIFIKYSKLNIKNYQDFKLIGLEYLFVK